VIGGQFADQRNLDDARDVDYDNLYQDDESGSAGDPGLRTPAFDAVSGGGGFDALAPGLEETLSEKPSLRDHLTTQLSMEIDDPVDRLIGLHLIDQLDGAGYISGELDAVADIRQEPGGRDHDVHAIQ